jgi:predicted ATPase
MATAVEGHEGTVELVTGDAVTAIFGVPVVHEDDAARAAKAAEDVLARLLELAQELTREASVGLRSRVGVSTGEVMTGGAVTQLRATGEPLTRAAELAEMADPDTLLLDEATRRAAPARDGGRFTSPMVGRARERRRLQDAFEQAATDRSCQLFTILGPAGVGKSRLVQEFLGDVSGQASVARGRCLPYGEGITYWPLLEVVKDLAGIEESEFGDDAAARVAALVEDEPDVAARVTELIGLREGSAGLEEGFAAVRVFFELLAARSPVVVVFDDVHWGEEIFIDLVEHLADWSRGAPLLLLCVARPELLDVRSSWGGGKLNATTVLLEPLSEDESAELVANLVGEATLAEEVQERIASAAEGNPLFVEEMLSMLIDEGALVREAGRWTAVRDLASVPVPPTIQALLAARLDQLGPDERVALEAAAVEGKVFHESSVADVNGGDSAPTALASLVRKELIRPERPVFAGERAFRFRHLMIRDATYDAIPKERRAVLHERHVAWLEERTGERSVEFDEILGYHLERAVLYRAQLGEAHARSAELGRRAAERLGAAARRAFQRADVHAGLNLASRAAVLLPAGDPLRVELVPNLRAVQSVPEMLELDWADRILTEAVEAAATTGDRRLAAQALVQRAFLRLFSGADVTGHELLQTAQQAMVAFEELGDELGLSRAWRLAGQAHYLERSAEESTAAAEQALTHVRRADDRFEEAEILEWLLVTLLFGPRPVPEAYDRCSELLGEVAGRPELEAMVTACLAWLEASRGRAEEARRFAALAEKALEEHGPVFGYVMFSLVFAHILLEDRAAAEGMLRTGHETLRSMGRGGHYAAGALLRARFSYDNGQYDDAERFVEEAARHSRANDVWNRSQDLGTRAKLLARAGDPSGAQRLAREAVAFAGSGDFVISQVYALEDLAEVLRLAGRYDEAIDAMDDVVELHERRENVTGAAAARKTIEGLRDEAGTQQSGRA